MFLLQQQTGDVPGGLVAALYNPWVVTAIMLITAAVAAFLWRYTEDWQRVWMGIILVAYLGWLLFTIFGVQ
jgi:hypothetical protein